MISDETVLLLNYLEAQLYDVKISQNIPTSLANNEGFLRLDKTIKVIREAAVELGNGKLSYQINGKGYVLGSLKSLQASLRNLTWKTKAIAAGDFSQSIHFLGEFSDSFNSMTQKLESIINEIKEVQEHFEMIFNTIPDMTIISNIEDGTLIAYNQAFLETMKFTKEELENKSILITDYCVDLDERAKHHETLKKNGFVKNIEINFHDISDQIITGLVSSRIIKIKGAPHTLSVIRDITERKIMEDEIVRLSITDKLTQSYNRLKLDETMEEQLQLSKIATVPFSILILDIDHFKQVNDNYGHQVGDRVLVELVAILQNHVRSDDVVGRWGGEEFLIILPNTDLENGVRLAEKLLSLVGTNLFTRAGQVTISIGVAAYQGDLSQESIVSRADSALYRAKKNGRNRVEYLK